jgi:hypothetical protein
MFLSSPSSSKWATQYRSAPLTYAYLPRNFYPNAVYVLSLSLLTTRSVINCFVVLQLREEAFPHQFPPQYRSRHARLLDSGENKTCGIKNSWLGKIRWTRLDSVGGYALQRQPQSTCRVFVSLHRTGLDSVGEYAPKVSRWMNNLELQTHSLPVGIRCVWVVRFCTRHKLAGCYFADVTIYLSKCLLFYEFCLPSRLPVRLC